MAASQRDAEDSTVLGRVAQGITPHSTCHCHVPAPPRDGLRARSNIRRNTSFAGLKLPSDPARDIAYS